MLGRKKALTEPTVDVAEEIKKVLTEATVDVAEETKKVLTEAIVDVAEETKKVITEPTVDVTEETKKVSTEPEQISKKIPETKETKTVSEGTQTKNVGQEGTKSEVMAVDPYEEMEKAENMLGPLSGLFKEFFGGFGDMAHSNPFDLNEHGYMHTESYSDGKMEKHDYVLDSQDKEPAWHERNTIAQKSDPKGPESSDEEPRGVRVIYNSPFTGMSDWRSPFENFQSPFSSLTNWSPFPETRQVGSVFDSFFPPRRYESPFTYRMPIKVYAFASPMDMTENESSSMLNNPATNELLLGRQMETAQMNDLPVQLVLTPKDTVSSKLHTVTGSILACLILFFLLLGCRRCVSRKKSVAEEDDSEEIIDEYVQMDKPVKYVIKSVASSINEKPNRSPSTNKRNFNEKLLTEVI